MRTIPDFPNYAITKEGQVWSKTRRNSKGEMRRGRWLKWLGVGKIKHYRVHLSKDGKITRCYVHRLVLETYIGPCPEGMECRHLDGNPANNNLNNLKWGTRTENLLDASRHKTAPGMKGKGIPCNQGIRNGHAKISDRDVRMIVYMYRTGLFSQREIAEIYGLKRNTISQIINKKSWGHLWAA